MAQCWIEVFTIAHIESRHADEAGVRVLDPIGGQYGTRTGPGEFGRGQLERVPRIFPGLKGAEFRPETIQIKDSYVNTRARLYLNTFFFCSFPFSQLYTMSDDRNETSFSFETPQQHSPRPGSSTLVLDSTPAPKATALARAEAQAAYWLGKVEALEDERRHPTRRPWPWCETPNKASTV